MEKPYNEILKSERTQPFVLIRGASYMNRTQRSELLRNTFNSRYKCRHCGKHKNIQIHHLYQYYPKDNIDDYKEFKKIPWIPLCIKCHMVLHGVSPPEQTGDD